jgi:tetratricopeptide (TPR) repeat protein
MVSRRGVCASAFGVLTAVALGPLPACRPTAPPRTLTEALLAVAREEGLAFDGVATEAELALLLRRTRAALEGGAGLVEALRQAVFVQSTFAREVDDSDLGFVLLPAVLADRRGSCVGLGTLYLALAEQLGALDQDVLAGVMVPGHFFVRATGPTSGPRNVELLREGAVMPDAFYRERYGARPAPAYDRPLTTAEIIAVVRFNAGNERRRQGDLVAAARAYAAAAAGFPAFAEAHASLGLTLQLQGKVQEARAAYAAARAVDPELPGLAHNLAAVGGVVAPPGH